MSSFNEESKPPLLLHPELDSVGEMKISNCEKNVVNQNVYTLRCLVCSKHISPQNETKIISKKECLLGQLCTALKFPTIITLLEVMNFQIVSSQFCELCTSLIVESDNILKQIMLLESNLASIRLQLRKCIQDCFNKETTKIPGATDEASDEATMSLRKLFVQCWSDCSVDIPRIDASTLQLEMDSKQDLYRRSSRIRRRDKEITPTNKSDILEDALSIEGSNNYSDNDHNDQLKYDHDFNPIKFLTVSDFENQFIDSEEEISCAKSSPKVKRITKKRVKKKKVILSEPSHEKANTVLETTDNATPFVCPQCGKRYRTQRYFDGHLKSHTGELLFQCGLCSKKYALRRQLQVHCRQIHNMVNNENIHDLKTCPHCDLDFPPLENSKEDTNNDEFTSNKSKLLEVRLKRIHMRNCSENPRVKFKGSVDKKLSCPHCDKVFLTVPSFNIHVATVHKKTFRFYCEICAKGFQMLSHLERHIDGVHNPEKKFECETCHLKFRRQHQLFYHRRRHTGELPFICEFCGKGFHVAEKLKRHSFIHQTEKKFPCHICGKRFLSHDYVHNHITTTHNASWKNRNNKKKIDSNNCVPTEEITSVVTFPPESGTSQAPVEIENVSGMEPKVNFPMPDEDQPKLSP